MQEGGDDTGVPRVARGGGAGVGDVARAGRERGGGGAARRLTGHARLVTHYEAERLQTC